MLLLPEVGIGISRKSHNFRLDAACDWVEASLLFGDELKISDSDIVDSLLEEEIYSDQDFAHEFTQNVFSELQRRARWIPAGYPFLVTSGRVTRTTDWEGALPHAFFLSLSLGHWYPAWAKVVQRKVKKGYNEQGHLFEQVCIEALRVIFHDWKVIGTGWSAKKALKLEAVVAEVAQHVLESSGDVGKWASGSANECGLDILCYKPLNDSRFGFPTILFQCASGRDWPEKLKTPDIEVWLKLIDWTMPPGKGFAMPFALPDDEFRVSGNKVRGVLLDRYRLLAPGVTMGANWATTGLSTRLSGWIKPRIALLGFN